MYTYKLLFSAFNIITDDEMQLSKTLLFKLSKMIISTIVNVFLFLITYKINCILFHSLYKHTNRTAVRESRVFWHHGVSIGGPSLKPLEHHSTQVSSGLSMTLNGLPFYRDIFFQSGRHKQKN